MDVDINIWAYERLVTRGGEDCRMRSSMDFTLH